MFTGIVEQVGRLVEVKPMAGGFRVRVATSLAGETQPGDSIAVNGVCLTALVAADGEVHFDIGPETARVTTLGSLERGQTVNLERPLRADARLGGHFVLGHVDGMDQLLHRPTHLIAKLVRHLGLVVRAAPADRRLVARSGRGRRARRFRARRALAG